MRQRNNLRTLLWISTSSGLVSFSALFITWLLYCCCCCCCCCLLVCFALLLLVFVFCCGCVCVLGFIKKNFLDMCVRAWVCACVRASVCVRACVGACVSVCACACACACVCVCVWGRAYDSTKHLNDSKQKRNRRHETRADTNPKRDWHGYFPEEEREKNGSRRKATTTKNRLSTRVIESHDSVTLTFLYHPTHFPQHGKEIIGTA